MVTLVKNGIEKKYPRSMWEDSKGAFTKDGWSLKSEEQKTAPAVEPTSVEPTVGEGDE